MATAVARLAVALSVAIACVAPSVRAQTGAQIGAWDALMLTPVGALTPTAHDPAHVAPGTSEIALRYGRWRFDADDAVHDNIGVSWSRHLGIGHTTLSAVVGYAMIECHGCSGWLMGGLDLRGDFWHGDIGEILDQPFSLSAGLRVAGGTAAYRGVGSGFAASASAVLPIDVSIALSRSFRSAGTFMTGLGLGSLSGATTRESAVLPVVGAGVAIITGTHLAFNFGFQRFLLVKTPSQAGMAVSWAFGPRGTAQP